jgi:hypothetical protein
VFGRKNSVFINTDRELQRPDQRHASVLQFTGA